MLSVKFRPFIYILIISIITFVLYYPGLFGDYVFDDMPNIINNEKLKIENLNKNELMTAFWSGDAGPLGRPISMLSFGINYYLTGFDSFYFKITNLFIHIINSILIYIIAYKIFLRIFLKQKNKNLIWCLAAIVSLIWAVHPINLTSVLYVVQRMTSLSALFGLLAMLLYCHWRELGNINSISSIALGLCIFFCLLCSVYSKESGLLFIPLIFWVELFIFQGKNNQYKDIYVCGFELKRYLYLSFLIGVALYLYLAILFLSNIQPGNRDFSSIKRLLSESRVIFYYLKLIFYPLLSDLSLYHDNFKVSENILKPISTLYSIISIILITFLSFLFVRRAPLILFAWGWYIISHSMESSFISLELVHEHRNYFSFIGFIIVVVYYVNEIKNKKIKPFIYILVSIFILNLSFTTWQRAVIWSNLVDHAVYEATMKPDSDRANYQLARIYMKLMEKNKLEQQKYAKLALNYMHRSQNSYKPANGGWFGEIYLNSYLKKETKEDSIDQLIKNLKFSPFYNSNINFISSFMKCQLDGYCNIPHDKAIAIISAGLENRGITKNLQADIYNILAQYFVGVAGDFTKGEEFVKDSIQLEESIDSYLLLAQIYRLQGKVDEANEQINLAIKLDYNKTWRKEIAIEKRNIESALQSLKGSKLEN